MRLRSKDALELRYALSNYPYRYRSVNEAECCHLIIQVHLA
jgi:hypothetical protein